MNFFIFLLFKRLRSYIFVFNITYMSKLHPKSFIRCLPNLYMMNSIYLYTYLFCILFYFDKNNSFTIHNFVSTMFVFDWLFKILVILLSNCFIFYLIYIFCCELYDKIVSSLYFMKWKYHIIFINHINLIVVIYIIKSLVSMQSGAI